MLITPRKMKLRRWEVESRHRHHRQRPGGVESADGPSFRDEGPSALPFPIPSCSGQIRISGFCGGEHDDHRLSKIRCRWHSTGGPDAVGVFWEGHSIAVAAAGPRVNKWTKTNEGLFSSFPERSDARPATKQFRGFFLFSLWFFFSAPLLDSGRNAPIFQDPSDELVVWDWGVLCVDLQRRGRGEKTN